MQGWRYTGAAMRVVVALLAGILIGATILWAGLLLTGGWYEYKMLDPRECALFEAARLDVSGWTVAPNQPHGCYLRRPRIRLT